MSRFLICDRQLVTYLASSSERRSDSSTTWRWRCVISKTEKTFSSNLHCIVSKFIHAHTVHKKWLTLSLLLIHSFFCSAIYLYKYFAWSVVMCSLLGRWYTNSSSLGHSPSPTLVLSAHLWARPEDPAHHVSLAQIWTPLPGERETHTQTYTHTYIYI